MIEAIRSSMEKAASLEVARVLVVETLKEIKKRDSDAKIGFVSGIVRPNGAEFPRIDQNLQRLSIFVDKIKTQGQFGPYIFSAAEVFNLPLYAKFDKAGAINTNYMNFWRFVLRSRQTDFTFMSPLWQRSEGSSAEFVLSRQLGLNILSIHEENGIIRFEPMLINKPSMMPVGFTA